MVRGKITGQYVNSILAKREAVQAGYDEAILLDVTGLVAEASGENVFLISKKGVVKTPPLSSPILDGITRQTAMVLLRGARPHGGGGDLHARRPVPRPRKSSSPGLRPKSPRCEKWTTAPSARAARGQW